MFSSTPGTGCPNNTETGTIPNNISMNILNLCVLLSIISSKVINFSFRAGLFPWAVGIPVFVLANAQFVADFRLRRSSGAPVDHAVEMEPEIPRTVVRRRTAEIFSWLVGLFVGIWLLGFPIGGPLCTFIQLKFGYREKWPITLMLTGFTWILIYGLFDRILHVPFPAGWLFGWF